MSTDTDIRKRMQEIMNRYDPLRLLKMGAPDDEYVPEIKRIIPRLRRAATVDQLQEIIYNTFVDMFDEQMAGPKEDYRKMSEEIYALRGDLQ